MMNEYQKATAHLPTSIALRATERGADNTLTAMVLGDHRDAHIMDELARAAALRRRVVRLHSWIERPDGRTECHLTQQVKHQTNARGQLRVLAFGRWRTVRDAARHPNRALLIRDDYTRTRVSISEV